MRACVAGVWSGEGTGGQGTARMDVKIVWDVAMFVWCVAFGVIALARVPLPYRSYGGRISKSTLWMPVGVFALYKLFYWTIGVDVLVGAFLHLLVASLLGTVLMFVSLAVDPDQCGPGVFLAFVGGSASSFLVPCLALLFFDRQTALFLTEAGIPAALGIWWALGRCMHSD